MSDSKMIESKAMLMPEDDVVFAVVINHVLAEAVALREGDRGAWGRRPCCLVA
jgi:hypothetical protein